MRKWKALVTIIMAVAMLAVPVTAMAEEGGQDTYRVCFVARASADTFAAWLTNEIQKAADQYDDIELTVVSGEADDNKMAQLLEDCITKQYDYVIVQSNNNAAQAPYVKAIADAGIPVVTTNPTTHQADLDGETGDPEVDNAVMAGITIQISSTDQELLVRADQNILRILFRNIIDNSIKYMQRHGSLIITASSIGDDIFIVCKDTGNGLSEKETEHVFDLNFQGSNRISGNGLGLFQAKAIVDYYGGTIYAKSNYGKGMGIYIQLPAISSGDPEEMAGN